MSLSLPQLSDTVTGAFRRAAAPSSQVVGARQRSVSDGTECSSAQAGVDRRLLALPAGATIEQRDYGVSRRVGAPSASPLNSPGAGGAQRRHGAPVSNFGVGTASAGGAGGGGPARRTASFAATATTLKAG
jgi:hypothetical protein